MLVTRAAQTPPAFIVDVLLGKGYIRVQDGQKRMGFDMSVICRDYVDMQIVVTVKQQVNGIEVAETRQLSCVELNRQTLLTFWFFDGRWTLGQANVEAALVDLQGAVIHEFQRTITVVNW